MALEIERRFRVNPKDVPFDNAISRVLISQSYANNNPDVRIRKTQGEREIVYTHCVKYLNKGEYIREEIEEVITVEQYNFINKYIGKKPVLKDRYIIPIENGMYAQLDYFLSQNVYVVEVEFSSIEEMENFTPPSWFGSEITKINMTKNIFKYINNEATKEEELDIFI